uniref:HELP domain-containing protein n=1 Tax=Macrostomum lignano TaxID=282301 RepID=A0A1I8F246_9PLAT
FTYVAELSISTLQRYWRSAVCQKRSARLRTLNSNSRWVYGYRGRDCRSNLYHLPTGELVYFVASVVVLHNVEEGTRATTRGTMTIAPGSNHHGLWSGCWHDKKQGKPHVRIWSSVDLTTLHVLGLGDFERAVSCLAFSRADGGTHLCVVDDANEHAISTSTEPVLACECHPLDAGVIITCGKNQLAFWTLEGCQLTRKNGIYDKHDKPKFVLCLTFSQNGDLITGDSNGSILAVTEAHEGGIFSLCAMKDDKLVSGGRDRRLVQWDSAYNRTGAEATVPEQYGPIRTLAQVAQVCILRVNAGPGLPGQQHLRVRLPPRPGRKYSRIGRCCGHSSFITHLDWSADCVHLRSKLGRTTSCCSGLPPTAGSSPSSLRDSEWASQRCAISFDTAASGRRAADGTDIKRQRPQLRRQLPPGTIFGQVCLYRYPCFRLGSKGHAAAGHSSHVTNVRFLRDSSRLLSTGGRRTPPCCSEEIA